MDIYIKQNKRSDANTVFGKIYNNKYELISRQVIYDSIQKGDYSIINKLNGQYWGVVETDSSWIIFADRFGIN